MPEADVEVTEAKGGFGGYGGYGASRFDEMTAFGSNYTTPGWQRAQAQPRPRRIFRDRRAALRGRPRRRRLRRRRAVAPRAAEVGARGARRAPITIEGELVAKSTGTISAFTVGDRVFHQKFGNGNVVAVDGNKLTIAFDKAGEKRVVDSFVERV